MSFADVVARIRGCSAFFDSQKDLLGVAATSQSLETMQRSSAQQIVDVVTLNVDDAAAINKAIAANCFTQAQKAALAEAVCKRCLSQSAAGGAPRRRATQALLNLEFYLTAADWVLLEGQSPVSWKITKVLDCAFPFLSPKYPNKNKGWTDLFLFKVLDRLVALGVTNPAAATVKRLVGVMAACHCPDADAPPVALLGVRSEVKSGDAEEH